MLVDDNPDDNFFHERVIMKNDFADFVIAKESGLEALDFLKQPKNSKIAHPNLIFLDINMPEMNGWEFLEEYEQLEVSQKGEVVLTMLSNSIDERDRERAQQYKSVHGFYSKPLNEEYLANILQTYFSQYL